MVAEEKVGVGVTAERDAHGVVDDGQEEEEEETGHDETALQGESELRSSAAGPQREGVEERRGRNRGSERDRF